MDYKTISVDMISWTNNGRYWILHSDDSLHNR